MSIVNQCETMNLVHGKSADIVIVGRGENDCSLQSWKKHFDEHNTGELEYPILAFKLSGFAKIRRVVNDREVSHSYVMPGDLIIVPSGDNQTWRINGEVGIAVLTFSNKEICTLLDNLYKSILMRSFEKEPFCSFSDPVIYGLCKRLLASYFLEKETKMQADYINTAFRFLEMYIKLHLNSENLRKPLEGKDSNSYIIDYAVQRLGHGYSTNMHIEDIAKELRISPSFLSKKFKLEVGMSPHKYLLQLRLKKARELLVETDEDISSIATECGFSHQSHLTRYFSQDVGTPPSEYRKIVRTKSI